MLNLCVCMTRKYKCLYRLFLNLKLENFLLLIERVFLREKKDALMVLLFSLYICI